MRKPSLFLIHGAWSTPVSFNHLKSIVSERVDKFHPFQYDVKDETITEIISRAKGELSMMPSNTVVVGHSLGGLIALAVHDSHNCLKIITVSAPLSGVETNVLLQPFMYSVAPILNEVSPISPFIRSLHRKEYYKSIKALVSTRGFNPSIPSRSDGVVSVSSQDRWLPHIAEVEYVELDHFEILQSDILASKVVSSLQSVNESVDTLA